jgi:hypothetical protein
MSTRAIEFVETWVSEKIEEVGYPEESDDTEIKTWATECVKAAQDEGIPALEINDAFDDLPAFIAGQIEEARERDEDEEDDEDDDEGEDEDDEDAADDEDDADGKKPDQRH